MTPVHKALVLLPMASALGLSGWSHPALAASWQVDSRWRAGAEAEDAQGPADRRTITLGGSVGAVRATETASTRLDAVLNLRADDGASQRRSDGRLGLAQSIAWDRDSFSAEAALASDSTEDAPLGSPDVLLGRGDRRTHNLGLNWAHRFTERLSSQVGASLQSTGYAATLRGAVDFEERSLSGSVSYALSEVAQASVTLGHSRYRAAEGVSTSATNNLRLGWSRQWSETTTTALSAGLWRTARTQAFDTLVCPVAANLCESGLENYIEVRRTLGTSASGSSFSATLDDRLDERTGWSAKASRDVQSSGAGVQRSDLLSVSLSRSIGPTLNASLSLAANRTAALAGGGAAQNLRSASLTLVRNLAPDRTLNVGAEWRRQADRDLAERRTTARLSLVYESAGPGLNR